MAQINLLTNIGSISIYILKNQGSVFGIFEPDPINVIIIETETKRYCGILEEKFHQYSNCSISSFGMCNGPMIHTLSKTISQKQTELNLICYPDCYMGPMNVSLININSIPGLSIDYVSRPQKLEYSQVSKIDNGTYKEIIVNFQLTVFEYESVFHTTNKKKFESMDYPNVNFNYPDTGVMNNTNLQHILRKIFNRGSTESSDRLPITDPPN